MSELRCPCKCAVARHGTGCHLIPGVPARVCPCELTEAQALRAAQRKTAIVYLKNLGNNYLIWLAEDDAVCMWKVKAEIVSMVKVLIAVGILGQRKGGE